MKIMLRLLVFFMLISCSGFTQNRQQNAGEFELTPEDAAALSELPELFLPEAAKRMDLPWWIDNSQQPYLRPVFSQEAASCGQAAGVGYNFTYEINRARALPADTSIYQYPTHFTYNFQNNGWGDFGVSYLHSFEILKTLGTPTVYEYGGMALEIGNEWVSGYDLYYHAMHNRISSVSQIIVDDEEGLLTLKHWLHNHLEGAETGGIASFYATSPWNYQNLPPESPEAGKFVMAEFSGSVPTHAMTIVGYNDSIRYDYNEDGQFTNHIDLNKDGVVDMKDWEIGGFKFVNSYGDTWADSGFCYMMYKTLADRLGEGGIWNHAVHVLDVNEDYSPGLTIKLTLKHDSREKIRIMAGVSADTSASRPEHLLGFPVFDFQGGHQYMQGGREDPANKTIEIGLDLTPLLSYVTPGVPVKFFLVINEDDPDNMGTGEIVSYSVMDYHAGGLEIHCPEENVPLRQNSTTRLAVVHEVNFDKVQIENEELPAAVSGVNYQQQMQASGGTAPYSWDMPAVYHQQMFSSDFPVIDEVELQPEPMYERWAEQEIEFDFPLYGEDFNKVYMHRDGFLMFGEDIYPWPYYKDAHLLFKKVKMVSAFLFKPVKYYPGTKSRDAMWYEGDETYAAFRWNQPLTYFEETVGHGEFAIMLYPDGRVEFYYNDIQLDENVIWNAGVSAGDESSYKMIGTAGTNILPAHGAYALIPEAPPAYLELSPDGLLSGVPEMDDRIYNLCIRATDAHRVAETRKFLFSDGLIFNFQIDGGADQIVQIGEEVAVDVTVKNIYSSAFHNVEIILNDDDPYLEISDGHEAFGSLSAGEEITIEDAFTVTVHTTCPDHYTFVGDVELSSDEADWTGTLSFTSFAPKLNMQDYHVDDNDNFKLDPGETTDLIIEIANNGHAGAVDVEAVFSCSDQYITINNPVINIDEVNAGESIQLVYSVTVDSATPISHEAEFQLLVNYNGSLSSGEAFTLSIGQFPVLIFNKSQNTISRDAFMQAMDELGVLYHTGDVLPADLSLYRSVFVCLGTYYSNSALSEYEGVRLSDYLDEGGNLYMEGTLTWHMQPQTIVHPRFGFDIETVSWFEFEQLTGIDGTFTQDMVFDFSGEYNLVPCYMIPQAAAFPVLSVDGSDMYYTAVAREIAGFRTVGSIFEFGLMGDETALQQRIEYLTGILEFFDLGDYIVGMQQEYVDQPLLQVTASPNPFREQVNFSVKGSVGQQITIKIFDLSGQLVKSHLLKGTGTIRWNGRDHTGRIAPAGIYIYQVSNGISTATGKLIRME
ncbi:MAG: T9SS type A sorting domain-containing protein [Bacteroidales bacterium]